ncbi:MAG: hypothetical protein H6706_05555 [Myxococcales bacterium]|nr:hypothetical protein [Myxococcales bacterium]
MTAILLYDHDPSRDGDEPPDDILAYDPHDPASLEAAREALLVRTGVDMGALLAPPPSRLRRLLRWVSEGADA